MKLFPQSPWSYFRPVVVVVAVVVAVGFYYRLDRIAFYLLSDKQEGDVLLQSLPHSELADAIETASQSPWSHCGILVKRDGHWQVAQALMDVHYTPLIEYLIQGRDLRVTSFRVKDLTQEQKAKVQVGITKLLGKPYDINYEPDDRKIYCSELVWKVYDRELGIHWGEWQAFGTLNWKPVEVFVRSVERGKVPLDRMMITPVGLTKTEKVVPVFASW
ncbi:MAG TPA: YiiX/YebB-like N1pC/P60 family cysteine hydrolase [Lacunisphaera sp.]|jgi:hypothetical protein